MGGRDIKGRESRPAVIEQDYTNKLQSADLLSTSTRPKLSSHLMSSNKIHKNKIHTNRIVSRTCCHRLI
ncbi:hypothetical protein HanIR_Chr09g0424321 [Helianthus annuus]|nr:hypothetical protein HanIR_Chr09g0424321 [Helianthus annuus]